MEVHGQPEQREYDDDEDDEPARLALQTVRLGLLAERRRRSLPLDVQQDAHGQHTDYA